MPGRQTAIVHGLQVGLARHSLTPYSFSLAYTISAMLSEHHFITQTAASQLNTASSVVLKMAMTLYDEDVVEEDAWFEWQGSSDSDYPGRVRCAETDEPEPFCVEPPFPFYNLALTSPVIPIPSNLWKTRSPNGFNGSRLPRRRPRRAAMRRTESPRFLHTA
jgi:hypothetical protein